MAVRPVNDTNVPERLMINDRRDYQRAWMIRNGRTKSVNISTEQLALMMVKFSVRDTDALRDMLGERTCEAALNKHLKKPEKSKKTGDTDK